MVEPVLDSVDSWPILSRSHETVIFIVVVRLLMITSIDQIVASVVAIVVQNERSILSDGVSNYVTNDTSDISVLSAVYVKKE